MSLQHVDHQIFLRFPMEGFLLDFQRGLMQVVGRQLEKVTFECFLFARIDLNRRGA